MGKNIYLALMKRNGSYHASFSNRDHSLTDVEAIRSWIVDESYAEPILDFLEKANKDGRFRPGQVIRKLEGIMGGK